MQLSCAGRSRRFIQILLLASLIHASSSLLISGSVSSQHSDCRHQSLWLPTGRPQAHWLICSPMGQGLRLNSWGLNMCSGTNLNFLRFQKVSRVTYPSLHCRLGVGRIHPRLLPINHVHKHFIPKDVTKFSTFFTNFFPVLAPTSGNRKCIQMANIFPFLIPKFSPFQIHFLSLFQYPFYPSFQFLYLCFWYSVSPFPMYFLSLFLIIFIVFWIPFFPSFCSCPFQSHFYSSPKCSHALKYGSLFQRQNRTQQWMICMYSSPLV